jgi:ArsR family transcriptional regulator
MEYSDYSFCFKTLGDETRLKITDMLKGGEMCACKILEEFKITQPTLSYHMKMLVGCGLVFVEKRGVWNHYSLNEERLKNISDFLNKINERKKINCSCSGCN